ncbi:MAG: hypothetical protein SFY80_13765 [Verrucomicrobiota bacterium]|nr:hypothetical protein [Verrucomicrobiota bacterium]
MKTTQLLLASIAMAAPLSGAVIFSDSTFSTAPVALPTYTEGIDSHNTYYTSGAQHFVVDTGVGSAAPSLRAGAFGTSLILVLPSSGTAETWNFSYDLMASSSWGDRAFEIIGLASGNTIDNNSALYGGNTTTSGTFILDTQFANDTSGSFTAQSYQLTIPSGLTGVAFRWFTDGDANKRYIDNITVSTVEVPEPAMFAASFALIALIFARFRRQH